MIAKQRVAIGLACSISMSVALASCAGSDIAGPKVDPGGPRDGAGGAGPIGDAGRDGTNDVSMGTDGANGIDGADARLADDGATSIDVSVNDGGLPDRAPTDAPEAATDAPATRPQFDWVGIIGTGQSLSVGAQGTPPVTTSQPYHNLKLLDTGPDPKYPLDGGGVLSLVPLVEPIRPRLAGFADAGGGYPNNILGETPNSSMANQITALSLAGGKREYVTLHSVVGWSGRCIDLIDKGGGGRGYPGSLAEGRTFAAMAKTAGKSFGYGAIVLTHGECDSANADYATQVRKLWSDYNADLKAITSQRTDIPLLASQQSSLPRGPGISASALAIWKLGVDYPGQIVCVGPKYQYAYGPDLEHLDAPGYVRLGEKYAQVYYQLVVLGQPWKPLQPTSAKRSGTKIVVAFDVPVPPLSWDPNMKSPHQTVNAAWANGKGFEVQDSTGPIAIQSVAIVGSTVEIALGATPSGSNLVVRYAMTQDGTATAGGTPDGHIGLLRDADGFVGYDAETIRVSVAQGSVDVTSVATNGFVRRAGRDVVTGAGLPADTIVAAKVSDARITLSQPWPGASGTTDLVVHHDQRNYAVHFELPVP